MRRSARYLSAVLGALAFAEASSSLQGQTLYDFLSSGTESVLLHNAYIFLNTPANVVYTTGTGSGNFSSFLSIQNNPNEEGFNTSANTQNSPIPSGDTKAGVSLQPNALQSNQLGDSRPNTLLDIYYVFGLDGQESVGGSSSTLSVDEVSLYYRSTPIESDPAFPSAAHRIENSPAAIAANDANDATKFAFIRDPTRSTFIWSTDFNSSQVASDHTLLIDYSIVSAGNGNADVIFAIPKTLFPPTNQTQYIYLIARMGYTSTVLLFNTLVNFETGSSFEEFGIVSNAQLIPPPPGDPVPEASTWAAMLGVTGAAGLTLWRRSRRAQAVAALN